MKRHSCVGCGLIIDYDINTMIKSLTAIELPAQSIMMVESRSVRAH